MLEAIAVNGSNILPEISPYTREETFFQGRAERCELAARIAPPDEEKCLSSQPLAPRKPVTPNSSVLNCTLGTQIFGYEISN
jgi:hypothetical protein